MTVLFRMYSLLFFQHYPVKAGNSRNVLINRIIFFPFIGKRENNIIKEIIIAISLREMNQINLMRYVGVKINYDNFLFA